MAELTLHAHYKEKMGFLEQERKPVEDLWRDIADVFSPSLQLYLNQREKKQAEKEKRKKEREERRKKKKEK